MVFWKGTLEHENSTLSQTDINQVVSLFYETVHSANARDYSQEQLSAWAPKDERSPEHMYLDPAIRELKTRIGFLESKLNRRKEEIEQLKMQIPSAVFGTKRLFKTKYTKECYRDNHDTWLQAWQQSRSGKMTISGRKDVKHGNFVFNYDIDKQMLHFKQSGGVPVCIENLPFPYGQENIVAAILGEA